MHGNGGARVRFAEVGAEVAFWRGEAGVVPVDEAVCAVRAAQGLVGRGVAVVVTGRAAHASQAVLGALDEGA